MQKFPENYIKAELVRRVNRFVAEVLINGSAETVYVPNTGRLSELALPGAKVLLSPINGKFRYKILYIISSEYPVMIDSTYSNRLFQSLIIEGKVPGLANYKLIRREPVYGHHRFDFLLEKKGQQKFLELKSCTLFHKDIASFPDAVSERASEHIKLLAETGKGIIVFFILKHGMKCFIPNYHTDFIFYETLKSWKERINIKALTIEYNDRLDITGLKEIPVLIPEVKPCGIFIILLEQNDTSINPNIKKYILLCGKDKNDVFKRIKKLRSGIKFFPHDTGIDYSGIRILADLPVITGKIQLAMLDSSFSNEFAGGKIIFHSEEWRVYSFNINPAEQKWFWDEIFDMRFGDC